MALVLLEARDAHDPERSFAVVLGERLAREGLDVDAVVHHSAFVADLVAVQLAEFVGDEVGAHEEELGFAQLVAQPIAAKLHVVGVSGARERQARQRLDHERRVGRVCREVRVDVLDAELLHSQRHRRGHRHDEERAEEEVRRLTIGHQAPAPTFEIRATVAAEPGELGADHFPRLQGQVVRPRVQVAGFLVHRALLLVDECEQLDRHTQLLERDHLAQHEGVGHLREARHDHRHLWRAASHLMTLRHRP
ncbi:MAG: hypothetical protein V9E99_08495 [Microthrixaceae bacterium]